MAALLRKINREAWAAAAASPLWSNGDCPPEALREVIDRRGPLSMWRIDDPSETARVIAAQALMQESLGEFNYILIDESKLKRPGVYVKATPNEHTLDPIVNERHVDVDFSSGKVLFELAQVLIKDASPGVMTKQQILQEVKKRIADTSFDRTHLFNKKRKEPEIAASTRLLIKLWKEGTVGVV